MKTKSLPGSTNIQAPASITPTNDVAPKKAAKKLAVDAGQTKATLSPQTNVTKTQSKNVLASRLALDKTEAPTLQQKTAALLKPLSEAFGALGPSHAKLKQEIDIGINMLGLEHGSPYGRLQDTLDRLGNVVYRMDENNPPTSDALRKGVESSFLGIFVDYLDATGDMLKQLVSAAQETPNLQNVSHLEERQRYAQSAARGGGKSENEQFGRLATKIASRHPEITPEVEAARLQLGELAQRAHQIRMDVIGVESGGLSIDERVALISIDAPVATHAILDARLDAVEKALASGAPSFASSLFYAVGDALPHLSIMRMVADMKKEPLDEATFAKRRGADEAPLTMAETDAINARMDDMRPMVNAGSIDARIAQMRLLLEKNLEAPRQLEYEASSLAGNDKITPTQKKASQQLLLGAFTARVSGEQTKLDDAIALLSKGSILTDENLTVARAIVQRTREFAAPKELVLDPKAQGALDAALAHLVVTGEAGQAVLEKAFDATAEMMAKAYATIQKLPADQQLAELKTLHLKGNALESMLMWLPSEKTEGPQKLVDEIYAKAFPDRA